MPRGGVPHKTQDVARQDLADLQRKFAAMSITGLQDFHGAAYCRCQLEGAAVPPVQAIQELVQAWKALRKAQTGF
jgi:hypothetical protein